MDWVNVFHNYIPYKEKFATGKFVIEKFDCISQTNILKPIQSFGSWKRY